MARVAARRPTHRQLAHIDMLAAAFAHISLQDGARKSAVLTCLGMAGASHLVPQIAAHRRRHPQGRLTVHLVDAAFQAAQCGRYHFARGQMRFLPMAAQWRCFDNLGGENLQPEPPEGAPTALLALLRDMAALGAAAPSAALVCEVFQSAQILAEAVEHRQAAAAQAMVVMPKLQPPHARVPTFNTVVGADAQGLFVLYIPPTSAALRQVTPVRVRPRQPPQTELRGGLVKRLVDSIQAKLAPEEEAHALAHFTLGLPDNLNRIDIFYRLQVNHTVLQFWESPWEAQSELAHRILAVGGQAWSLVGRRIVVGALPHDDLARHRLRDFPRMLR